MSKQTQPQDSEQMFGPEIRRARLSKLTIYDVEDYELDIIERGTPDSIYLTFATFLLSSAISFSITLFTTTINSDRIFVTFVVFTVIAYISGLLFLSLWYRNRQSVSEVVDKIRKRLPPEGTAESFSQEGEGPAQV